jgi:hypothetical protein
MRFFFRLAGLAIILWLHHPLLANPATADKAIPLRERDRIAVQVIFSYGDSHTKTLQTPRSTVIAPITAWIRSSSRPQAAETSASATA